VSYLAYVRRKLRPTPFPVITLALIGVTAAITALQFVVPGLLALFRRNPDALTAGEVWRIVTPMFVQPAGVSQCIANAFLLGAFMWMVEKLYGRGLLLIYFGSGILAQIFLNFWLPDGGGSSSAAFGLIGAIYCFLLRERRQALMPFVILPVVGLLAGLMLAVFRDGHGAGMLLGATISSLLPAAKFEFVNGPRG
jgi:rhomboid protease GluP